MTASKQKCPRCKKGFECKANSISECQCSTVTLTEKERAFISTTFDGCLCVDCLKEIKVGEANLKLPR